MRRTRGFTLIDLLVALALTAVIALVTVPPLLRSFHRLRLDMAARETARILQLARSYAALHNARVGVKFYPGEGGAATTWALYLDGDGDGVLTRDLRRGIDPPVPAPGSGVLRRARFAGGIGFGFPAGPLPRDPSGRQLTRRHDPIRFNRSDIASFGPLGTATPGTLYLSDGLRLAAVRVTSSTGRVRILTYRGSSGDWGSP